jgi:hypothetical protein
VPGRPAARSVSGVRRRRQRLPRCTFD